MTDTFESILDKPIDDITRPPPMPAGSYVATVVGLPTQGKSSNEKQTPFYEFKFNLVSPMEDVDQEKLAEIGGLAGKTGTIKFYLTEDSAWRLKEFLLDHLGITGVSSIKQAIAEAPNRQCVVVYKSQPSRQGDRLVSFIDSTAKA